MRFLWLPLCVALFLGSVACSSSTSSSTRSPEPSATVSSGTPAPAAAAPEQAAPATGGVKTASGLIYRELTRGTGASPGPADVVKVNYRGTLLDGTEFDSSYKRNQPIEFPLNQVIPCWTEGVQLMKTGGKAQLQCPASIAYGERGSPPVIPGGATLNFEIELLAINGK